MSFCEQPKENLAILVLIGIQITTTFILFILIIMANVGAEEVLRALAALASPEFISHHLHDSSQPSVIPN